MFEKLKNWFSAHLLDDWKQCYKWYTMHAAAIGIALTCVDEKFGETMPRWLYGVVFFLIMVARVKSQGDKS